MDRVKLRVPVSQSDHIQGPLDAPLELVEYGDYECPFSALACQVVQRLQATFPNELRYVFRNFPLQGQHPYALQAARTAEAAAFQDRFWEMNELIYANQDNLDDDNLLEYAAELDLNLEQLMQDMEASIVDEKIMSDLESGARSGVDGTPTFYINGYRYDGDTSYDGLMTALETARDEAFESEDELEQVG